MAILRAEILDVRLNPKMVLKLVFLGKCVNSPDGNGILFCSGGGAELQLMTKILSPLQKRYSGQREIAPEQLLFDKFEVSDTGFGFHGKHVNA